MSPDGVHVSERTELARVELPEDWLSGRSWLFTEVIATKELADGLAVIGGGVLDDGTNVHWLAFPGGQRIARHCPPDWKQESRSRGVRSEEMDSEWESTLEALDRGMAAAALQERGL